MRTKGGLKGSITSDKEKFAILKIKKEFIKRFFAYAKPHAKVFFFAAGAMVFATVLSLLFPYLTKVAVDEYIIKGDLRGLSFLSLAFILLYILFWFFSYWQNYLSNWLGYRLVYEIRMDLYSHLLRNSMAFFQPRRKGEIVSRVINDVNTLADLVTSGVINLINDFLVIGGSLIIMFSLHSRLTLISFVTIPVMYFTIRYFGKRLRKAYTESREKIAELNADVQENISGIRVVKSMSREDKNMEHFEETNMDSLQANMKIARLFSLFFPAITLSNTISTAIILWYGGGLLMRDEISIGVFMAFLGYIALFFGPIRDLSQVYNVYQSAAASLTRIFTYMDIDEGVKPPENPCTPPGGFKGKIELKNISFNYGEEEVLNNINIEMKAAEKVALVGSSGGGKTTLAGLILRLYDPLKGEVIIDGINIKNISFEDLRQLIGAVPQDPYLFSGTIKENIAYGKPRASETEIIEAAKGAQAHSFIEKLPQGYASRLGEEGQNLSGGQKQLISLARAYLANSKILILDEATSNVDPNTEELIAKGMELLLKEKTAIIIAHRFTTIEKADKIYVLDKGEIVAEGKHDILLKESEIYKDLYDSQM